MANLPISENGKYIQVFTPKSGATLPTTYTPTEDEVVCVATAVDITLDSKTVTYAAGSIIGLQGGTTYTLNATTDVHKM